MAKVGNSKQQEPIDESAEGRDRRRWQRVLVNLEVDYGGEDTYLFAYIQDISATGIFIKTNSPEAAGTHLNLRFTPTDGGELLEVEGEVIWVNPYRPSHPQSLNPGMGVRFVGLSDEARNRVDQFVKTFAYLDG